MHCRMSTMLEPSLGSAALCGEPDPTEELLPQGLTQSGKNRAAV
jgi:hypothetical protein